MSRALLVLVLAAVLALPEAALANGNGGVAYSAAGGSTPHVVRSPKPPKKRRRHKKRPPRLAPAHPTDSAHRLPLAGPFTWPGPGGSFGAGRAGHIHQGIDLLAASGTPIVAPEAGTVTFVSYQAKAAGYYVVLHSPDYDYAFMHLLAGSTRVHVGQNVAIGDPIGLVGQTGDAEAPHLHFEVWVGPWQQGGRPIDPAPLLHSWPAVS
jgi:murein DD-endopeptidase MepM/ murein hydrolase activator NlpD